MPYGHSGNWLGDLHSYAAARLKAVNLGEFTVHLDEDYIAGQVEDGLSALRSRRAGDGRLLWPKRPRRSTSSRARAISRSTRQADRGRAPGPAGGESALSYDTLENLPQCPISGHPRRCRRSRQDAYFAEGGWEVVDEVVGCKFDIHEAETLWTQAHWMETVSIPLEIRYPAVTGESLRALLFRDMLGTETTYFPNSVQNRVSNINLAASKLDGIILYPGDELSYNQTIGQRTLEAGFLEAGAYADGEVVEEIGGGICQVSSTLYCAVVNAPVSRPPATTTISRWTICPSPTTRRSAGPARTSSSATTGSTRSRSSPTTDTVER